MRLASMFGTGFVSIALLAMPLGVEAAPPATPRGLDGDMRASFVKNVAEACVKDLAGDADDAEMPKAKLVSVCRCAAESIAARATRAQLDRPESLELRAIIAEAVSACLDGLSKKRASIGQQDPAEPPLACRRSA